MNIEFEYFRDAIENLEEVLAERGWHKHEPRCGYQRKYVQLEQLVSDMQKQFQSQLPTAEDIQKIYRENSL